jgi:hypothetical protein
MVVERRRVDFRHHQGDLRVHPEGGTVVDHDAATLHGLGGQGEGDGAAGAEDREIKALEGLGLRLLDDPLLAAVDDLGAGGPGRGEGTQLGDGEAPLGHQREDFLTHGASHAHDADAICHVMM